MPVDVSTPIAAHARLMAQCRLPLALMGGTAAMRAAGKLYLPIDGAESEAAYASRLGRTTLFNAYRKAVRSLRGKVFSKPIQLGDDASPEARAWAMDTDMEGRDLTAFAYDVFEAALVRGLTHILVDYPQVPPGATLADERAIAARPYFVHVLAEDLIGWRIERIGGQRRLMQARIREVVTEPDGEWGEVEVEQIRVLEPGGVRIYRQSQGRGLQPAQWAVWQAYPVSLPFIPLVTVYTGRVADMEAEPPLMDLAEKNLEHWQSASDQRHILHVARVPILFGPGWNEDDTLVIGPNRLATVSNPQADLKFVEHSGAAIGAGEVDLRRIKEEMALLSLEPLLPRTGNQTATARALDQAEANSALQAWAENLSDALALAFFYAHQWIGGTDETEVRINTDFGLSASEQADLDTLTKARLAGDLSRRSYWAELQRRDVLRADFDAEAEEAAIEDEGPALGMIGADGAAEPGAGAGDGADGE